HLAALGDEVPQRLRILVVELEVRVVHERRRALAPAAPPDAEGIVRAARLAHHAAHRLVVVAIVTIVAIVEVVVVHHGPCSRDRWARSLLLAGVFLGGAPLLVRLGLFLALALGLHLRLLAARAGRHAEALL